MPDAPARSRRVPLLVHMQLQQPHLAHTRHGREAVRGVRDQAGRGRRTERRAKGDRQPHGNPQEEEEEEEDEAQARQRRRDQGGRRRRRRGRAARRLLLVSHRLPARVRDGGGPASGGVRVQGQVHRRRRRGVVGKTKRRRRVPVVAASRTLVQGGAGGAGGAARGWSQGGGVRVPVLAGQARGDSRGHARVETGDGALLRRVRGQVADAKSDGRGGGGGY
mmetsp:Transcript_5713/g.26378  ORF Transcript_5713/g.26378 Transcript_5713/m.26378 type:complete len:221 (-) Transcript_5713:470-1132(-)